jgi:hypothetical protein
MNSNIKNLIFFYFFLVISAQAQTFFPDEKLFLRVQNDVFSPKDTVFFSVKIVSDTIPSKVIYVELISPDHSLFAEKVLKNDENVESFFVLPADSGTFTLRAYTNYLAAFGSNAIFHKNIKVVSKKNVLFEEYPKIEIGVECGILVDKFPAKVIVSTETTHQKGKLIDEANNKIADFETNKAGLAEIPFVPMQNRNYRILLNFAENDVRYFTLPEMKSIGTTMNVFRKDSLIITKIYCSQTNTDSLLLVIRLGDRIFDSRFLKKNVVNTIHFPIKLLPKTLLTFEVFNDKNQRLAERLFANFDTETLNFDAEKHFFDLDFYLNQKVSPSILTKSDLNNYLVLRTAKSFDIKTSCNKEMSLTRTGVALDENKVLLKKTDLLVMGNSKIFGFRTLKTDTLGHFAITNIENEGILELKIQTFDNKLINVHWIPRPIPPFQNDIALKNSDISNSGIEMPFIDGKLLDELIVKGRRNYEKAQRRAGITYFYPERTILANQIMELAAASGDVLDAVQSSYAGISFRNDFQTGIKKAYRRGDVIPIFVDGIKKEFGLPNIEMVEKIDVLTAGIFIYTKSFFEVFGENNGKKAFDGNAILKGFDKKEL